MRSFGRGGSRGEGLGEAKFNVEESTALELASQLRISKDEAVGCWMVRRRSIRTANLNGSRLRQLDGKGGGLRGPSR
jgi:hypothetical protein